MNLWAWRHKWARRDNELDEEIQTHLRMAERDLVERGEDNDEAHVQVRREFGNVVLTKEVTRSQWRGSCIEPLILDLRIAVRRLGKNHSFTATAVLVLALGICASAAIFAFVDAALLKPLPYTDRRSWCRYRRPVQ